MGYSGTVVMITGASRGIGRAIADRFYEEGAALSLGVRNAAGIQDRYDHRRCCITPVDVADTSALTTFTERTLSTFGRIDVLVNNAGIDAPCPLAAMTEEHLHEIMRVNFYSAVMLSRFASAPMIRQRSGHIINMSSIAGKEGTTRHIAYTASKHALIAFTKCAARELIPHGVVMNAVCPGLIDTDMLHGFFEALAAQNGGNVQDELAAMIRRTPRGVIGQPADVAELVWFLCSSRSRNIVGQAINTDGGFLQW